MSPLRSSSSSLAWWASILVIVGGCGDSDAPKAAAPAASSDQANAALAGDASKAIANASDLVGAWYRDGVADAGDETIGLEFSKDGKVRLVGAPVGRRGAQEVTLDYAKIENGRVRLSAPGNAMVTQVVQCNLSGDRLTVVPETQSFAMDFAGGGFVRLPAGKTIVARHAERQKEIADEREAFAVKLADFLRQPDLAIVPGDGGGPGSTRVAVKLRDLGGQFSGTALMTVANSTVMREAQMSADLNATPQTVTCTLGNVIGPDGAPQMQQEAFTFKATTKDGKLDLRDDRGQAFRPEPGTQAKLQTAYDDGIRKRRERLDAFHATLGALVLAEGESRPGQPTPRAALLRVPDKDQYMLATYSGSEAALQANSFTVPHVVMLQNDEALLVNPQSRQILAITGTGDARSFEGNFNGTNARMKITRAMSFDELKARQAELKAFIDGMRAKPLAMSGQFYQSVTYEHGYVRPVRLELTSPDGKELAGTFHADAMGVALPIAGEVRPTLLGLQVKFALAKSDATQFDTFDEGGTFSAEVALVDGNPSLVGRVQPGDGANRLELALPDAARCAALRKQFDAEVARGGTFKWGRTGNTGGGAEVMTLQFNAVGADGNVTGTAGFRKNRSAPIAGKALTEDGFTVLDLTIAPVEGVTDGGPMRLWVVPYGQTFYLSGTGRWPTDDHPRFVCYGPQ